MSKRFMNRIPIALLGLGVALGVGGGLVFGGYKLHGSLSIRNKSLDFKTKEEERGNQCPLSDNFERLFDRKNEIRREAGQDLGARVVY